MDMSALLCNFSLSGYLYLLLFVLIVVVVYLPRWRLSFRCKNLPPGPFCWPVIGYSGFFDIANIHLKLKAAADKYGGVFSIYIGNRLAVVIDDFETLKKAFNKDEFLNVVPDMMKLSCTDERMTSILELNGQEWREQKKFWQSSLRYLGLSNQGFRASLKSQISQFMKTLKQKQGEKMNLLNELNRPIADAFSILLFGKPFKDDLYQKTPVEQLLGALITFTITNSSTFIFPWSRFAATLIPAYRKSIKDIQSFFNIISAEIAEHRETLDANDPRDFMDLFLLHMQKPGTEDTFNASTLVGNGVGVFVSYVYPIKHHVTWFLLLMAAHPEVQDEIYETLQSVVGQEREPLLEDKPQLPLLESAILETLRFRNIMHLNFFKRVNRDTTLNGFDMPKDTLIIHNMTSQLHDPKFWTDPETFNPKRFLTNDGKSVRVPEHFVAFSVGKRVCLGEGLAKSVMFLYLGAILSRFQVLPPDGGVNLDIKFNFGNDPAHPYVKFQKRY